MTAKGQPGGSREEKPSAAWRNWARCVAVANACLIRIWCDLLAHDPWPAHRDLESPGPVLYAGAMLLALLSGTAIQAIWWGTRSHGLRLGLALFCGFLFAKEMLMAVSGLGWVERARLLSWGGAVVLTILVGSAMALAYWLIRRGAWFGRRLAAAALPLVAITFGNSVWRMTRPRPEVTNRVESTGPARQGRRAVWIVFDELDEDVAFTSRPKGLKLPAFDRFRAEARFVALDAISPANATQDSIPALVGSPLAARLKDPPPARWTVGGQPVEMTASPTAAGATTASPLATLPSMARPMAPLPATATATAVPPAKAIPAAAPPGRPVSAATPPGRPGSAADSAPGTSAGPASPAASFFDRARQAELRSGIVGWAYPYCQMVTADACAWWPMSQQHNTYGRTVGAIMARMARSLLESNQFSPFGQSLAVQGYAGTVEEMAAAAARAAARLDLDLVYIHVPPPHNPYLFDPKTGKMSVVFRGPVDSWRYLNNLQLADRVFAQIRRSMEAAGVWERSIVVITADHGFRRKHLMGYPRTDRHVPFMVKSPGIIHLSPREHLETRCTGELLLEWLKNPLS